MLGKKRIHLWFLWVIDLLRTLHVLQKIVVTDLMVIKNQITTHGVRTVTNLAIPENDVGTFMEDLPMQNQGDSLKARGFKLLQQTKQRTPAIVRQLGSP